MKRLQVGLDVAVVLAALTGVVTSALDHNWPAAIWAGVVVLWVFNAWMRGRDVERWRDLAAKWKRLYEIANARANRSTWGNRLS